MCLLERNEARRVRSSDAGPSVLHRLVRDRELAEVVADHLGLDLGLKEHHEHFNCDNETLQNESYYGKQAYLYHF